MKYIQKGRRPHPYVRWCSNVAGTDKEDYRELPRSEKEALLKALIQEQGALCAYTMRRIGEDSSHIEHIKPQGQCRADKPGSDLDYANLVACFPRDGMKAPYRYGAQQKDDWWEGGGESFVSPLQEACEKRFRFDMGGNITAVGANAAAATTIKVLALDHPSLTEDRKRVIEEFIYGPAGEAALSHSEATRAEAALCSRYAHGYFREFCIAIRHALEEYLRVLRRRAQRKKAVRGRN